ncbi:MAG TPA: hypothetical protein VFU22_04720, partial [Roseiflexaceae bacterium]|nr:hypothetical protein [Roseiflexaceae bacterium]
GLRWAWETSKQQIHVGTRIILIGGFLSTSIQKVTPAEGEAPRKSIFLALVVRRSRTTSAR